MRVSIKVKYALLIVLDLAARYNETVSVKELCARQDVPIKYAEKLAGILKRAGFLKVVRGAAGGYRLSRPPEHIKASDIVRLMEGVYTRGECGTAERLAAENALERVADAEDAALAVSLKSLLDEQEGAKWQIY